MFRRTSGALHGDLGARVLVIGDTIVDINHRGTPLRSAGVSLLRHKDSEVTLGGAAFLVRNMLALGGRVTFVTMFGSDEYSRYGNAWKHKNLNAIILTERARSSTVKERFWAQNRKHLAWDRLDNRNISKATEKKIASFVRKNAPKFDRIVVSDYRHGLLTRKLARALIHSATRAAIPIYVDSQVAQRATNHLWYRGADLVIVNVHEARAIDSDFDENLIEKSAARVQAILGCKNLIIKLGRRGSFAIVGPKRIRTPALALTALDDTGAGDAFFAVIALSKTLSEATLKTANAWAGLKTKLRGTKTPRLKELQKVQKKGI